MTTLLLFVILQILPIATDNGAPFIRPIDNIPANVYGGNKRIWDLEFDDDGLLYVAASEHLCIWDGMDWHSLKAADCLRDLCFDRSSGRLYASGANFFGYWESDRYGRLDFKALYHNHDNLRFQNFWKVIPRGNELILQTHGELYIYDMTSGELKTVSGPAGEVGYIFDVDGCIYGQVNDVLYSYSCDGGNLQVESTGIEDKSRIVEMKKDGDGFICISEYGGIRRYSGDKSYDMFPRLNALLKEQRVFSAKIRDDGSYFLGTVSGGAYLVGRDGSIKKHFDKSSGMDYSTVLSLGDDRNGNLWLGLDGGLAHYENDDSELVYLSKSDIGDVYSSLFFKGQLYLGTNKGLYRIANDGTPYKIPGMNGVVWQLTDCDGLMAVELDNSLYSWYPDGHYEFILPDIWRFSKWRGTDNLYFCSDSEGIVFLEKRNGHLTLRNRLDNCSDYSRVPLKNDERGSLWVDGLWGGVQRLSLDNGKRSVIKDRFYPVGDRSSMTLSHYIDNRIVFTQGKDCYVYDCDKDEVVYSRYYSEICHYFETDVFSLAQADNLFFNFGGDCAGLVERQGDRFSYISGLFHKTDSYEFSENYSKFTQLNDTLMAIGCNNGLVLYNVKAHRHMSYPDIRLRQCRYTVKGDTHYAEITPENTFELPFNASDIVLQMTGISYHRTVYYSLDDSPEVLLTEHSFIRFPYLSDGRHHIVLKNGPESEMLDIEIRVKHHWALSWWFLLLSCVALAVLLSAIVGIYKYRTRMLKLKYSMKQKELMEKERIKHENEMLSIELREKNAKLTTLAINDITINNMLKEIEDELSKVSAESKELKTAVRPVKKVIDRYFRENGSWEAFKMYFNGIYDGFFDRLKAQYPQLTQNEVKICSYIRLGMSTKEIASLMNIEIISAESARYRLRRNMGLAQGDSLSDIISKI